MCHPHLNPSRLAAALGWRPSDIWESGDGRRTPAGTPLSGTYKQSYCTFDVRAPGRNASLDETLALSLDHLDPHGATLRRWANTGGRSEFFVGLYVKTSAGYVVDAQIMRRCAKLGINFGLLIILGKRPAYVMRSGNILRHASAIRRRLR
jgi:hypothetical protein